MLRGAPLRLAPCKAEAASLGRIAQVVEQLTLNQRVQGSSPCAPTSPTREDAARRDKAEKFVMFKWLLIIVFLLGGGHGALAAEPAKGEFEGECVMGLALGKVIRTDCSVSTVYEGKTYCFGNETARTLFLKKPEEFLLKAHVFYSSKQP